MTAIEQILASLHDLHGKVDKLLGKQPADGAAQEDGADPAQVRAAETGGGTDAAPGGETIIPAAGAPKTS